MTNRRLIQWPALFAAVVASAAVAQPTSAPIVVDATDSAAIASNLGKEVVVEGVVDRANWSKTGSVFFINFKGVERGGFTVVAFEKLKAKLDAAFMGDAAKDFTGAKLRVRGTVAKYKDAMQVAINDPSQVTIVEPAAGNATTKP